MRAPVFSYNHDGTDGDGRDGRRVGERRLLLYRHRVSARSTRTRSSSSTSTGAGSATSRSTRRGSATVHNFGRRIADGMVQVLHRAGHQPLRRALSRPAAARCAASATSAQATRRRRRSRARRPRSARCRSRCTFSSLGSFDPDAQPLSLQLGRSVTARTSTQRTRRTPTRVAGVYTATLTVTELTAPFASRTARLVITVGNKPPLATITPPRRRQHVPDRRRHHVQRLRHVRRRAARPVAALLGAAPAPQRAHPLQRAAGRQRRRVHRHRARRQHVLRALPDGDGRRR